MDLTPEEILELHKEQESDINIKDFVSNLYNQDKNNTTDPKKAKGDVKKDANTDPKNTASKSANGLLESLAYDTDKTYEELRQEALERKGDKPLSAISKVKKAPNLELSKYINKLDEFRTSTKALLKTNTPYQLGLEGDSYSNLSKNPDFITKLRNSVEELHGSLGKEFPSSYDIDNILEEEVNKLIAKENKFDFEEKLKLVASYKKKGDYKRVLEEGFKQHASEMSDKELKLFNYIKEANSLRKQRNNTNKYDELLKIDQRLNELKPLAEKALIDLGTDKYGVDRKEYAFAYDPLTGYKLGKAEVKQKNNYEDWEKPIQKLYDGYKELDLEALEQKYFKHTLDYQDVLQDLERTVNIKPSDGILALDLSGRGYKFNEEGFMENVKYKDLMGWQNRPDLLQKSLYVDPKAGATILPNLSETLKYISKERNQLIKEREALKTAYLLNIDPASIKQEGADPIIRFFETAIEGAIGEEATRKIGTSVRRDLDDLQETLLDAGVKLTPKQEENFERSFGMEVVEGVGYFVPELAKFAVANKFAGATGITTRIARLLNSKNKYDKTLGHAFNALLEEAKFEAVTGGEAQTLSGAGFYAGGQFARFIPKLKGESAAFNSFIEKTGGGFIGGVGGGETAKLAEAMYNDLNGNKSFKKSIEEYYGDVDDSTRRILIDGIVFSILGAQRIKSKDFKSISKRREIRDDLAFKIEAGEFKGSELEKKKLLYSEINRDIDIAYRDFNNLDILSQRKQRDAAQAALNKGGLSRSEESTAKNIINQFNANSEAAIRQINRQFNRVVKSGVLGDKVNLEIIEGEPGGDKANYDPNTKTFRFDILQYKPGVLAQEVGHSFMSAAFEQNKEVAETFKKNILDVVNKSFKGLKFNGLTFEEAINEGYDIAKQRPEEYVMNIVEFLSNPEYKDLLLEKGFLKGLKREAVNAASKIGIGQSVDKNLNTGADVMEFLFSINQVAEKGTSRGIRKKFDQFKNLLIEGDKLIDIKTGSEVVSEKQAEKEMASIKIEESEKKDIFTKANKAYEELKDTSPSDAGLMVGMEFQPIVEKKVRSYLKAKDLQVPEYVIEDIVADVSFGVGKGSSSIPTKVIAYDKVQKLIKYIKQSNPSEADISAKAKELNVRSDAVERAVAFAKGDKAEASMTSYVFGQLNNSILASFQKPEYRDMFKTVSFDADPTKTQNIAESEGLGGGGFVDISSPVVYTRASQKKVETQLGLKENYIAKAKEVGEKILKFVKLENLDAMFVGTLKTSEGKEVFAALLPNDKARVTVDGVTEIIKARNPKAIEQRYGAPEKSFKKSPTTKDQIIEFAKDMLLPELEKEAGDLKDNYTATEKYSSFVDKAFPLFKSYISQSAVNKRMKEFKEPVIDPATGKPAREKTAAGRGIFKKKDITLAEWRKYYIGDGKKRIDGRRRSLLEAIATEQGFDKVMETLGDKALREQVESRQEDLNVDLLDNYVAVIAKSLDRNNPTVMASIVIEETSRMTGKDRVYIENALYAAIQEGDDFITSRLPEDIKNDFKQAVENLIRDRFKYRFDNITNKVNDITKNKINVSKDFDVNKIKPLYKQTTAEIENSIRVAEKIAELLPKELSTLTSGKSTKLSYRLIASLFGYTSRVSYNAKTKFVRSEKTAKQKKGIENIGFEQVFGDKFGSKHNELSEALLKEWSEWNSSLKGQSLGYDSTVFINKVNKIADNTTLNIEQKKAAVKKLPEFDLAVKDQIAKDKFLNLLLKTIGEATKNLNAKELRDFAYGVSSMLLNNDGTGIRNFSSLKYIDLAANQGKRSNEHLQSKAEFAARVLEAIESGTLTTEKVKELTSGYNSEISSSAGQSMSDLVLGRTIENAAYLKMVAESIVNKELKNFNIESLGNKYNWMTGKSALTELIDAEAIKINNEILKADKELNKGTETVIGIVGNNNTTTMKASKLITLDNAIKKAKDPNKKRKGISVFDFDDTLARTKSNVLYTMPNGKRGKLNAEQFAKMGDQLLQKGAEFDFSEFSKVVKAELGPLFKEAQKKAGKFTTKDIFVLTARPAASAKAIRDYLKSEGLDIPLENITGLGDSRAEAKAEWMTGKVAKGYNDFYFADDAIKNVKAVKQALDLFDVKSDVQQAIMASKDIKLDNELAKMIERKKGISSERPISASLASNIGRKKGKFDLFLPPNAEDFAGLMYKLYGKGKQGDADMAFIKEKLLDPYNAGEQAISTYKQNLSQDYKSIEKQLANIKVSISPETKATLKELNFNADQAVRVALWNQAGYEIPGISNLEAAKLRIAVIKDKRLKAYADGVKSIIKGDMFEPSDTWYSSNIRYDLFKYATEGVRSKFLEEWSGNIDAMFTPENYSRMEAAYGSNYVKNLKDMVARMKSGKTRPLNLGKEGNAALDYINGSVGVTMWVNTRSAMLQTISAINYTNWSDNNPLRIAQTFANPKKFAKTFVEIFNSDFLKQRRSGLELNVEEAEIAKAVERSRGKASSIFNYLIKVGFKPTQIADSFAIASGGTPFLINRTKTYEKQGLEFKEAREKAFKDLRELSEENQQSSRMDRVSNIQTGILGRMVFAFNNTPMQMTRLQKKAALDLVNRRGDFKTNISKLVYYAFIQSAIFYSLQQATSLFMFGGDDENLSDTEKDKIEKYNNKKVDQMLNSMLDSFLSGSGLPGKILTTSKNTIKSYLKEDKKGYKADYGDVINEAISISPTLSTKTKKAYSALKTFRNFKTKKGKKELENYSKFGPLNPVNMARAKIFSAATNVPADRMLKKIENVEAAFNNENIGPITRTALMLGWDKWSLGFYDDMYVDPSKIDEDEGLTGPEKAAKTRKKINNMKKQYKYNASDIASFENDILFNVKYNSKSKSYDSIIKKLEDKINKIYKQQDSIKDFMLDRDYKLEGNKFVKIK